MGLGLGLGLGLGSGFGFELGAGAGAGVSEHAVELQALDELRIARLPCVPEEVERQPQRVVRDTRLLVHLVRVRVRGRGRVVSCVTHDSWCTVPSGGGPSVCPSALGAPQFSWCVLPPG